ncbi:DUF1593 domain-containing protein [Fulvivirgaceae bacterium BMA10]|uniref:DUF1593 domain-containing protein n=1 Tax=Splendidivirga corallicola TaxID=3051826 RepID=A0ABT8KRN5_9BACT|nr:DUF1593 domain-containing protein [Fulvivirgaceae bacterium BMA10]
MKEIYNHKKYVRVVKRKYMECLRTFLSAEMVSYLTLVLIPLGITQTVLGQGSGNCDTMTGDISGSTTAAYNSTVTYNLTVTSGAVCDIYDWIVTGGTKHAGSTNTQVTVTWNQQGQGSIEYYHAFFTVPIDFHTVTITGCPAVPSVPVVSNNNCGPKILTRGSPPSGETWYWQGTNANGTSTTDAATTYSAGTSGTYYLRAQDNTTQCWSDAVSVSVTVNPTAPPPTPNVTDATVCYLGSHTLTASWNSGQTPTGGSFNWYTLSNGGNPFHSGSSYAFTGTLTTTYYVSATLDGCESARVPVTATVRQVLDGGKIISDRSICGNISPGTLYSGLLASGGTASYNYQWEKKEGAGSWTTISGATGEDHTPTTPSTNTIYRRKTTDNGGCGTKYSNEVTITVLNCSDQDVNHVVTSSFLVPVINENALPIDVNSVNKKTGYFDGLGRPVQTVIYRGSPAEKDVVQVVEYDVFGRQEFEYLPYVSTENTGNYKTNPISNAGNYTGSAHYNFYNSTPGVATDSDPYAKKKFEASPLNRVLEQGAPGTAWQPKAGATDYTGNTIKFSYEVNNTNAHGAIRLWTISAGLPTTTSSYAAGELTVLVTEDEEGNHTREYTDKLGRTILKQVQSGTNAYYDTYYVYDDFGNLRFVFPPEASEQIGSSYSPSNLQDAIIDDYAFYYKYDERQWMVEKKVPGADVVYLVYDQWDRLVLTQDGNQRGNNQWSFTKYDVLNRPIVTGVYTDTRSFSAIETDVEDEGIRFETATNTAEGYTLDSTYPTNQDGSQRTYLTITYYDDYSFLSYTGWDAEGHTFSFAPDFDYTASSDLETVKGQVTGSKTKVLGTDRWLNSVTYYDDRYRVIQTITENYVDGTDKVTNTYFFPGWLKESKQTHTSGTAYGSENLETTMSYAYDHAGRLETVHHQITGQNKILMTSNSYNELGELIEKDLHSENLTTHSFMQSVDYRYNIRGWLTQINNSNLDQTGINAGDEVADYFGMELFYNEQPDNLPAGSVLGSNFSLPSFDPAHLLKDGQPKPVIGLNFPKQPTPNIPNVKTPPSVKPEFNIDFGKGVRKGVGFNNRKLNLDIDPNSLPDLKIDFEVNAEELLASNENLFLPRINSTDDIDNEKNKVRNDSPLLLDEIWLEAECGIVGSTWQTNTDGSPSNGEYVQVDNNLYSQSSAPTSTNDRITYTFDVNSAGNYIIWGRVITVDGFEDSFWVRVDNGNWIKWNSINHNTSWHWDEVHDNDNSNQVVNFNLSAGSHTLDIAYRDGGTKLDKIYVTNTGNTPSSSGGSASNCSTPPAPPSSLTATAASSSQIDLTWVDGSSTETGFEIERSTGNNSSFTLITTTAANATSYNDTGLTSGTIYYYRIRAIDASTQSTYSNEANATTTANGGVELWLEAECGTIGSTWQTNADAAASNGDYVKVADNLYSQASAPTGVNDRVSYSFNVSETGTYRIWGRVIAVDGWEDSFWVRIDNGTWIKWNNIDNSSSWLWDEVHDNDNSNQVVDFSLSAGSHTLDLAYRDGGAQLDKLYITNTGNTPSGTGGSSTNCSGGLTAPGSLTGTVASATQIDLSWVDESSAETGFEIERSVGDNSSFTLLTTTAANAISYNDTGLTSGTTYYYRVRAVDASTQSAYSNEASATPFQPGTSELWLEPECGTVGSLWQVVSDASASNDSYTKVIDGNSSLVNPPTASSDHIRVSFNITETGTYNLWGRVITPTDSDDSFWIRMDGGTWIKWNDLGIHASWDWLQVYDNDNNNQVMQYSLSVGAHYFDVAYREDGAQLDKFYLTNTTNTPSGTGTTATNCSGGLTPPSSLTATVASATQIDLSWVDESSAETGFEIERSVGDNSSFILLTTTAANATSYNDTGLTNGTTYYYRVRAVDASSQSAYSNETNAAPFQPGASELWLEPECGTVGSLWQVVSDASASNGSYTKVIDGNSSFVNPPTASSDHIRVSFNITETGTYNLWGRVITPTDSDDSFWIRMDGGTWIKWNDLGIHTSWDWLQVYDNDNNNQVMQYSLSAGAHYFDVAYREDGAQLDKFYLTNTTNTPSGTGTAASNCSGSGPLPFVTITTLDANAYEAGQDAGTIRFSRNDTAGDLTINYTTGGSASSADYQESLSGSVTIPSGSLSTSLTISATDDSQSEDLEVLTFTVSTSSNYIIDGRNNTSIAIIDNDQASTKARVLILTDAGPAATSDPDDLQSLVRALIYTDQYDLEGIVVTTSYWTTEYNNNGAQIDMTPAAGILQAYEDDFSNLSQHTSGLLDPAYVWSVFKKGNDDVDNDDIIGMDDVGTGLNSEGSDFIISAVDNPDPRPLNILIWGGANTLAQTIQDVAASRTQAELDAFIAKMVVHESSGQDDAGAYVAKNYSAISWIRNVMQHRGIGYFKNPAWDPPGQGGPDNFNYQWVQDNIEGHGNLGTAYPDEANGVNEGDTPTLLWAFRNGLNGYEKNSWGSWGGRFTDDKVLGTQNGTDPPRSGWVQLRQKEEYLAPFEMYIEASDTWYWEGGNVTYTDNDLAPLFRWREQYQNDFAARMDWAASGTYASANHNPVVHINGDATKNAIHISAAAGATVSLDAAGTTDPDANTLTYTWWAYEEPGTYSGSTNLDQAIASPAQSLTNFTIPSDGQTGETIHVILTVKDNGSPALYSNRRVVITIGTGGIPAPTNLVATSNAVKQISLTWTDPSSDETGFVIEMSNASIGGFVELATVLANTTSYSHMDLNPGQTVYYRVKTRTASGDSDPSNVASAQTLTVVSADNDFNFRAQYNGNISAIKWKTQAGFEPKEKIYLYEYDKLNRLTSAWNADRTSSGASWANIGSHSVHNISYDANGNIETLNRQAMGTQIEAIDALVYTYSGNQLMRVADDSFHKSGFNDGHLVGDDYDYDANGNMTKDENKGITSIEYNILNLPQRIIFDNGNEILYTYDAAGTKLRKEVIEGATTTITDYVSGVHYTKVNSETGALQFAQTHEGRVVKEDNGAYTYEYNLTDHLGNVRATFTTDQSDDVYQATMEDVNASTESQYFQNITGTTSPGSHGGTKVARLDKTNPMGPAISLEVRAGDIINIETWAYYEFNSGYGTALDQASIIAAIAGAFGGINGVAGEAGAIFNGVESGFGLYGFGGSTGSDTKPFAHLNYLLFDKNYVPEGGGFLSVPEGAYFNSTRMAFNPIQIEKDGYIYVYLNNSSDSDNPVDFDDLTITHTQSPVVSSDDYYPFGLTFNSAQKIGGVDQRYKFNGVELNPMTSTYETLFRGYDPALGRFMQIDPLAEFLPGINPYQFGFNNPIGFNDPDGLKPDPFTKLIRKIRLGIKRLGQRLAGDKNPQTVIKIKGGTQGARKRGKKKSGGSNGNTSPSRQSSSFDLPDIPKPDVKFSKIERPLRETEDLPTPVDRPPLKVHGEDFDAGTDFDITFGIFGSSDPKLKNKTTLNNYLSPIADALKFDTKLGVTIEIKTNLSLTDSKGNPIFVDLGKTLSVESLLNQRGSAIQIALIKLGVDPAQVVYRFVPKSTTNSIRLKIRDNK